MSNKILKTAKEVIQEEWHKHTDRQFRRMDQEFETKLQMKAEEQKRTAIVCLRSIFKRGSVIEDFVSKIGSMLDDIEYVGDILPMFELSEEQQRSLILIDCRAFQLISNPLPEMERLHALKWKL